jgi:exodeoxyribonuclease VII small subunit
MENFEANLERVKELLQKLNSPDITLREAVECYKEGMELLRIAQRQIEEAELIVQEIAVGEPTSENGKGGNSTPPNSTSPAGKGGGEGELPF